MSITMESLRIKADHSEQERLRLWVMNGDLKLKLAASNKLVAELNQRLLDSNQVNETLKLQLDATSNLEGELNQRILETNKVNEALQKENLMALNRIQEEEIIMEDLQEKYDQLKAMKSKFWVENGALKLQLKAVKKKVSDLEQQLEAAKLSQAAGARREEVGGWGKAEYNTQLPELMNITEEEKAELSNHMNITDEENSEFFTLMNKPEYFGNGRSAQSKGLEANVSELKLELASLSDQKREFEEQIKSRSYEAKMLKDENLRLQLLQTELQNRVADLDRIIKEKNDELSAVVSKLENDKNNALSQMKDLTTELNALQLDLDGLCVKGQGLEEQVENEAEEAQRLKDENLALQENMTKMKLDTLLKVLKVECLDIPKCDLVSEIANWERQLESQIEKRRQEVSDYQMQVDVLNCELKQKIEDDKTMLEKQEDLTAEVKNMKQELENVHHQQHLLELQIETRDQQAKEYQIQMEHLNKELAVKIADQQETLKEKEKSVALINELELELDSVHLQKNQLEMHVERRNQEAMEHEVQQETVNTELARKMAELLRMKEEKESFKMVVNKLQLEVNLFCAEKTGLELQIEKEKRCASERHTHVENQNHELTRKIADHENMLKDKEGEFGVLQEEVKTIKHEFGLLLCEYEHQKQYASERDALVEKLNLELTSKISDQESILKGKEGEIGMLQEEVTILEHKLESLKIQLDDSEQEKQHASKRQIEVENLNFELTGKIADLETMLTDKEGEIRLLLADQETVVKEKEGQIGVLQQEVKSLEHKLGLLNSQLDDFVQQKQYASERQTEVETLNLELASKIADQELMLKEKEGQIGVLQQEVKTLEHKLALLHFQLDDSEQLFTMIEESSRLITEKFQQECMALENQICQITAQIASIKETRLKTVNATYESMLAFENIKEEDYGYLQKCFSSLFDENAKQELEEKTDGNAVEKPTDKKQKEIVSAFSEKVSYEEEDNKYLHIINLFDELEKQELKMMEGNVGEEPTDEIEEIASSSSIIGGELEGKVVAMLEKKVEELEKNIKEKDVAMVSLEEEKKEAIRQLCVQIDYQRDYCNHLKELLLMKSNKN